MVGYLLAAEKIFPWFCNTIQEIFVSLHRELKNMVIMAATKLISIRVDEDILNTIDDAVTKNENRKRSDYVNAALRLMAWAIQNGKAYEILRFHPQFGDVMDSFVLGYHRQHR